MRSLPLSNATRRLGAPDAWNHADWGICHTLEICDQDGFMISAWVPSAAELARLNEGKPIFLRVRGTVHPVVALTVGE